MDIKELKFVRLTDPSNTDLIPRYLIDQTRDKDFETDRFYAIAPLLVVNRFNIFGLFVDNNKNVKGFLWATINILSEQLYVSVISIDKEYQNCNGDTLEHIFNMIRDLPNNILIKQMIKHAEINLKKTVQIVTKRPKVYEKRQWRCATATIMEKEI